jgi:PAS domain S-box-containing protein
MPKKDKKKVEKYVDPSFVEEMERTAKLLVRRDLELSKVNNELDEKIRILEEDEKKLKEMNEILEIRLRARTRQLRENIDNLDRQVKERTKKLEDSKKVLLNILEDLEKEKIKAEEEKEKTLAIIKNFSDGLLIFDNKNKLTILNSEAEKYLSLEKADVVGKSAKELFNVPELNGLFGVIGKNIDEVFRKELEIKKNLILEVSVALITSDKEKIGKFVILHDITREKTVQRLKTEFVSIAAHQLRTPLSAIKWTLTALLDGDLGEIVGEQKEYLQKANLSNERMINLVDNLLNLSRIEEGRYVQKNDFFKLEEVVYKVVDSLSAKANKKNIKLNFEKPKNLPKVLADKEKIKIVVQNLVDNAINYSFEGREIIVSVKENKVKKEIIFQVENDGIGISKSQQKRIFTKFFRMENAIKTETVGSGLGLFISKNIIESHGGRIWFESEENKKTIFYFAIPIKIEARKSVN